MLERQSHQINNLILFLFIKLFWYAADQNIREKIKVKTKTTAYIFVYVKICKCYFQYLH